VQIIVVSLFFLISSGYVLWAEENSKVVQFYQEAKLLAEEGEYSQSLKYLNRALGYLRQSPVSDPLRIAVEKEIRIVKGKFLVARYQERMKLNNPNNKILPLPLAQEPSDVIIQEYFGKILAREIWQSLEVDDSTGHFGFGRRVTVLPKSGISLLIQSDSARMRTVDAASFIINKTGSIDLHTGSYCFYVEDSSKSLLINSPLAQVEVSSGSPFACMIGVTTNGGLKVINLLGKAVLKRESDSLELLPGQLVFSLPDGFSRTMDVELSTLMVTSNLLTGFQSTPLFFKKLRQQAMLQALRTTKRFRTLVGDVKGRESFQMKVLEDDRP
jgi:hypothetical protein